MPRVLDYNKRLKVFSRQQRTNMTDAERRLWFSVRGKQLGGAQFYRQKPIGKFIVDFYCPAAKFVVELDGGQHFTEAGKKSDQRRDFYLKQIGVRVFRFTDLEVINNLEGVLKVIQRALQEQISPCPSLRKRGEDRYV